MSIFFILTSDKNIYNLFFTATIMKNYMFIPIYFAIYLVNDISIYIKKFWYIDILISKLETSLFVLFKMKFVCTFHMFKKTISTNNAKFNINTTTVSSSLQGAIEIKWRCLHITLMECVWTSSICSEFLNVVTQVF